MRRLKRLEDAVARPDGALIDIGIDGLRLSPRPYRHFLAKIREVLREIEGQAFELPALSPATAVPAGCAPKSPPPSRERCRSTPAAPMRVPAASVCRQEVSDTLKWALVASGLWVARFGSAPGDFVSRCRLSPI